MSVVIIYIASIDTCCFQCTSNSEKIALSSDANHNSVLPACSPQCNSSVCADTSDSNQCTSIAVPALHDTCCVAENQPAGAHSDPGYASDGDCESCSSQSLARSGGESENTENSHSSGCCSPSASTAAVETGISPLTAFLISQYTSLTARAVSNILFVFYSAE